VVATARCVAGLRRVPTLSGLRQTPFVGVDELE
jgi:hypothetical protein